MTLRRTLIACTVAQALALPGYAQEDGAGADEAKVLEQVLVVGSRIKRVDIETSQPVFVVEKEDLQRMGLANVADLVTHLIYADNSTVTTVTNNTNGNDNTVEISLRNLGADRTLVLVNGRRWVGSLEGVVDLNNIPLAIVERIEVLKDGASAIYGSDAIAGVINIVTRDSYDGMEVNAYFGEYEKGDGRSESYDYTVGASTDRASLVASLAYTKQEPIFADSRERTREPFVGTGRLFGSANPEGGRFTVPGQAGCGANPGNPPGCTLIPGRPGSSPADFRPYVNARDSYNFAPINYLLQKFDRTSLYVQGRYNLTDSVAFFTQAQYIKRRGDQQIAEVPFIADARGFFGPQWDFGACSVDPGNVFNPFGRCVVSAGYRFKADGPRRGIFDFDTWAYTGGLEGTFDFAGRAFSWDATYQYLQSNYDSTGVNYVNLVNLRNALGPSFRDAGGVLRCGAPGNVIAGCIPFNVFGGPDLGVAAGVITAAEAAAMIDYVAYELVQTQEVNTTNYTANVTGDLFGLPAGPLAFAAGYEYRGTDGRFQPDSLIAEGGSSTNFNEPTSGNQKVDEFYGELNVPLLADLRFAEILELSLAGRYSSYSSDGLVGSIPATAELGDTTNFKAGFRWKPIADLLLRGNWAETFRAPSVADLFGGGGEGFGTVNDPCRNALASATGNTNLYATLTPEQQQRCVDQGVPPGGNVQGSGGLTRFLDGGNRFLDPELGTNRTLGAVYSPGWLEGLDLYLDWYRTELDQALTGAGPNTIVNRCIRNGEQIFCNFIQRIPGGEISELRISEFNASLIVVEGWDAGVAWRRDTSIGRFTWAWNIAYLSRAQFTAEAGDEADNLVGESSEPGFGLATWRLRSNAVTSWSRGDWDATWNLRYLSPLEEDCTGEENLFEDGLSTVEFCEPNPDGPEADPPGVNRLGSVTYHDFQIGWSASWNGRIAVGVRNAFDKQPPIGLFARANSTLMGYDLPDSRFWYASYSQKF